MMIAIARPVPTTLRPWPGLGVSVLLHGVAVAAALVIGASPSPPPDDPPALRVELVTLAPPPPEPPAPLMPERAEPRPPRPAPRHQAIRSTPAPHIAATTERAATPAPDFPAVAAPSPVGAEPAGVTTGASDHAAIAGPAGPPLDYISLIRSRLERGKRYPHAARLAGEEGAVRLRLALDRDGEVVTWRIESRSGADAFEDAIADMVRRAAPFPPFPAEVAQDRLDLVIPVEFALHAPAP